MSPPTTTGQHQQIITAYQAGHSTVALGRSMGYHYSTIRRILIRHGIPRRLRARLTPDIRASIASAYRHGAGGTTIAAALGVSEATVYRALDAAGVPRRRRTTTTIEETDTDA
jgi:IS30 family transposase